MSFPIKNRIFVLTFLIFSAITLLAPLKSFGQLRISNVEVFWEDSLVVIQPEIHAPFSQQTLETLRSGINIALDVEIQFIRTGYVKREYIRVPVQYNVFTDRYRVTRIEVEIIVAIIFKHDRAVYRTSYRRITGIGYVIIAAIIRPDPVVIVIIAKIIIYSYRIRTGLINSILIIDTGIVIDIIRMIIIHRDTAVRVAGI